MVQENTKKSTDVVEDDTNLEETLADKNDNEEARDEETLDSSADKESSDQEAAGEPDLDVELARAVAEKDECQDKMLRMAAELANYKKRMIRERDNALKYAGENLIKDLLPTVDNLGRALEHEPNADVATFIEGVDMTLKGLLTTLEKSGLSPIESVGETFDPNLHEAMVMEASKDVPDQCIISEFEKGYYYKDRLIRAAKVIVSKGDV